MRIEIPKIKSPKDYEEMRWLEKCKIRQFYSSEYGWLDWLWED